MKSKIKKRKFIFDKKIKDITINNEELTAYELIPGLKCDLPDFSYDIVNNITILVAINTTLIKYKDKKLTLKKIDLTNKNNNMIIIKSDYQTYFDFVKAFVILMEDNIENIQLED